MAASVFVRLLALGCLLAAAKATSFPGYYPALEKAFYLITNEDGGNLAVDSKSYQEMKARPYIVHTDDIYPMPFITPTPPTNVPVVNSLATDGDYEKWSVERERESDNTDAYRFVNKATGLFLTVRIDLAKGKYEYVASQKMKGDPFSQRFRIQSTGPDVAMINIHLLTDKSYPFPSTLTSTGQPTMTHPRKSVIGAPLRYHNATSARLHGTQIWNLKKLHCEPHPDLIYRLAHVQNGDSWYMRFNRTHNLGLIPGISNLFPLLPMLPFPLPALPGSPRVYRKATDLSSKAYQFKFIPTKFDPKIFYIQHPLSGGVLDIGRNKSHMAQISLSDRVEGRLSQHWYILAIKGTQGKTCIIGSEDSYRYLGRKADFADGDGWSYVYQKEQTPTLDVMWYLEPAGSDVAFEKGLK